MSVTTDLYHALFGKNHIQDGDVISFSEHGRVGGVSTGQGFKFTSLVDVSGNPVYDVADKADDNNASETPLAGDATFTGSATDTFGYSSYSLMVHSDVASATDGLVVEYSADGSDWHEGEAYTYPGGGPKFFTPPLQERYVRVSYTNGSTLQTTFHLHPVLRKGTIKPSSHNINDNLNDDDDGELVVAVPKLRTAQNTYISQQATSSGNAKVSLEEYNGTIKTQGLPVQFFPGTIDTFGVIKTSEQYNEVDVQFFSDTPQNLLTVTTTNSGTASSSNGGADFATSTNVNGTSKGVTARNVIYKSASEVYAYFTASFTTPTSANSFQRLGLYNDTDGFFLGYEGTTFGATVRKAGVDTTVAKANFSEDDLTGGANSLFLRDGTPEAIDLTKINVFRIRFGWLGSAPVDFEVLSPDGKWVTFHIVRQPNLSTTASIENPNLPMTVHVSKTSADATNLIIHTNCWGAGTTNDHERIDTSITDATLAKLVRSVLSARKPDESYTNIEATAGGNLKMSLQEISDGLDVGNGAVGSETQRVTIANDSTGRVFTYDHLPTEGNNPSTSITEAVVGTVTTTTIQKTIGATTYQQTIEEDSSDNSTTISAWSVV